MSESIEGPNLNFLSTPVDRVSKSRRLRESHDQDYPLPKLKQKKSKHDREEKPQDDFEKESSADEMDEDARTAKKKKLPPRCEGPGLVIDVTA